MVERKRASDGSFARIYGDRPLTKEEMSHRAAERKRLDRETNREEHTRKNREWNFRRKYGITLDQYNEMRMSQDCRCAICGRHENDLPKKLSRRTTDGIQTEGSPLTVDHCHLSGRIRQLLCFRCNQFIGFANEDPDLMRSAILYVERHRSEMSPGPEM